MKKGSKNSSNAFVNFVFFITGILVTILFYIYYANHPKRVYYDISGNGVSYYWFN